MAPARNCALPSPEYPPKDAIYPIQDQQVARSGLGRRISFESCALNCLEPLFTLWIPHLHGNSTAVAPHPLLIPVVVHSHHLAPAQANHGKDRLRTPSSAHRYRIRISGRPVRRFDGCGEVHSLREADRKINLPGRLAACFRKLWTRSFEITTTQGLAVTVSARSFAFRLNV